MPRILDAALNTLWAMEPEALERLLTIAGREHSITDEALEKYRAKAMAGAERASVRNGVAILNAEGALFAKANLLTEMSGATSYELLMRDFQASLDDSKIKAVAFNIDSPGGAAAHCSELAQAIYDARGKKPIVAYVGGAACSAAYWIASACDRVVGSDTAEFGCLGVQMALRETEDPKGTTTYTFVSSQTPLKNPDPASEDGAKAYQSRVDAMASVFLEAVARNRGVDVQTVLSSFGKGGTFIGKDAVKAGLADAIGSFESVIAELGAAGGSKSSRSKGSTMSEQTGDTVAENKPVDVSAAVASAVTAALAAERTRAAGIDKIAVAHGVEAAVVAKAKEDGLTVEAFALSVAELTSAKAAKAKENALAALKTDEVDAGKVAPSTGKEGDVSEDALAAEIAAS